MKIKTLSQEEQTAIINPKPAGPTKTDLLKQLEADYLMAKRDNNEDLMAELDARHDAVSATNNDKQALEAYEYREPANN